MDQPLGLAIGNALEIKEALNTLRGKDQDLLDLCLTLGSQMVLLARKASYEDEARKMLLKTIEDGSAIKKMRELIVAQGGSEKR